VDYYMPSPPRPLQVWELKPGRKARRRLNLDNVSGAPDFSPDEKSLAVGLPDGAIVFYDPKTGDPIRRLGGGHPAETLSFSPDGRSLAVASSSRATVEIRDLDSGKVVRTLKHEAGVQAVAWRPGGAVKGLLPLLATGCRDQRIYLWEGREGESPR